MFVVLLLLVVVLVVVVVVGHLGDFASRDSDMFEHYARDPEPEIGKKGATGDYMLHICTFVV